MAELITRQMRANDAARVIRTNFKPTQYWEEGWPHLKPPKPPARQTYEKLVALGDNPNPDDVDDIMGGEKYTFGCCYQCDDRPAVTANFDINCGEFSVELCATCLRRIAEEVDQASP